jgi:hypothetical protein
MLAISEIQSRYSNSDGPIHWIIKHGFVGVKAFVEKLVCAREYFVRKRGALRFLLTEEIPRSSRTSGSEKDGTQWVITHRHQLYQA